MSQTLTKPFWRKLSLLPVVLMLVGCGGGDSSLTANLTGQVAALFANPSTKVTHYAASRFLEQAAMGPSPPSVAQVKSIGMESWVAAQLALPATTFTTPEDLVEYDLNLDRPIGERMNEFVNSSTYNAFVAGDDQLRLRTSWILSNFLVVSTRKVSPLGGIEFFNMLQTNAFGNYADLLRALSKHAAMGEYLDNFQNRRDQLNENYGRELMQLFSVGLVQLNMNGTTKKDATGKPLETYSQKDVIEISRALTGWKWAEPDIKRKGSNWANFRKPMAPQSPDQHDTDSKVVLGKTIPAGQDAYKDLDSVIEILINHPNTAPFISLRLIQGMTTSDPSPAYLERVATVFKDTKGNLGRVVTAILLDPEARAGDVSSKSTANFGRIKEPVLMFTSGIRGLGCRSAMKANWNSTQTWTPNNQRPFFAYSVFGFYPPNHRTQGTNVLAPEHKMLNSNEFSTRMSMFGNQFRSESSLIDAGCDVASFKAAAAMSDEKLMDLMSERYFRGAIPASVAKSIIDAHKTYYHRTDAMSLTGAMLDMASLTPIFGVSK
jgi:uncharacterized protein (DUF1800 family)